MARHKRRNTNSNRLLTILFILLLATGLWFLVTINKHNGIKNYIFNKFKHPKQQVVTNTITNDCANAIDRANDVDIGSATDANSSDADATTIMPSLDSRATKPQVAIIVDDLGYAPTDLIIRLCNQPVAFDVAILPYQAFTKQSAEIAHSKGKEVMLHLPMEPDGYPGLGKNPGQGAIMVNLSETEVKNRVHKAILAVPFSKGVNNHMGSRITKDRMRMLWVMREIKSQQQFFVDSWTEKKSIAFDVATELAVPAAKRQVFLDNDRSAKAILRQWKLAMSIAKTKGKVIVIAHMHPETVTTLEKIILAAEDQVDFIPVSRLLQ